MKENREDFQQWIAIHEGEMLQDLAGLVAVPGISAPQDAGQGVIGAPFGDSCRKALEQYLSMAQRDGMSFRDLSGYCGEVSVGPAAPAAVLGIWNHLDVVPAGEGWDTPPFRLAQRGKWLLGRGVQDNKGPLTAVYYVLRYLHEKDLLRNIKVRQLAGCDEERGMEDVSWFCTHEPMPDMSFVADCSFPVCCGEKGKLSLALKSRYKISGLKALQAGETPNSIPAYAKAILPFGEKIEGKGISGHAAFPEGTVNAVFALTGRLLKMDTAAECQSCSRKKQSDGNVNDGNITGANAPGVRFSERERAMLAFLHRLSADGYGESAGIGMQDEPSGRLTCNLGRLRLQDQFLWCSLDIRYPVTAAGQQVLERLRKAEGMELFEIVSERNTEPYYREPSSPFVRLLQAAYQRETGMDRQPYVMGGGTYAARLSHAVGFGTGFDRDFSELGLRPGDGNCHAANEAERIDNLEKAMMIYLEAILAVDAWKGERT